MKIDIKAGGFWRALLGAGAIPQALAVVALSCVLGLAYNAASPVGIRWSESDKAEPAKPAAPLATLAPVVSPPVAATNAVAEPTNQSLAAVVPVPSQPPPAALAAPPQYVPPTGTTWAEVEPLALKGAVVLVDARGRAAYDAGHIPGAVLLPEPPSAEELAAFRAQYPTNSHLVVYCSSTSCSLSFKLAHRLAREAGYTFVQYMTGGYLDWQREQALKQGASNQVAAAAAPAQAAEMPPQDTAPVTPPIAANPDGEKLDNALPIMWAQAKPMLATGQVLLVDARPKADYDAGHIPGALWLPADASGEVVRQILGDRPKTTRVVAYCGSMGCPQAFQLATRLVREFSFPNAQFMLEGYAEWRRAEANQPQAGGAK